MKRVYILLSGSLIFFVGILIGFIMTAKLKIDTKAYAENPIKEIRKEEIKFDSKNPFAKIALAELLPWHIITVPLIPSNGAPPKLS